MRPRPSWNWLVATFLAAFIFPFGPEAQANLSDLPPAKLTASAGADVTGFGISVGVSGDTVVVGASSFVSTTERSAHVFVRPAAGWNGALAESARLTMPGGSSDSGFGQSVAVSGDIIVVGAPGAENGKGAAYVFVKPAGGWSQSPAPSAMLTAFPDPTTPQRAFGHLVAVDGDTIVVSPDASAGQGTVYVFVKPVGGWRDATENAKLAPDVAASDFFGGSLAVDGDTVVVGAPGFPNDRVPGAAYVFVKPVGGWTDTDQPNATLIASDPVDNGGLGISVGVKADTIAVVGFARPSTTGQDSVAYTFVKPVGGWSDAKENARLVASDRAIFQSVAVRGDRIIAGAPSAGTPSARGAAYVFVRPSGGWSGPPPNEVNEAEKLVGDAVSLDLLGSSVAMSGDTIVVGAPSLGGRGSAYVFGNPAPIAPIANAGPDQTADDGALVTLDGSASSGGSLTFGWTQLAGLPVELNDPSSPTPRFTAPLLPVGFGSQTLTFQLTVTGNSGSSTDTVDVTVRNVNHAPVADAGGEQGVNEGSPVVLSGSLSYDPDSDPLTFRWTQISGTPVALSGADTDSPTFTAPVLPGSTGSVSILTFALTVSDGAVTSTAETRVTVEQVNHLPVADDGADQTVAAGALVGLNASGSFDPDGDPITYSWTQTGGTTVVLSDPNTANPSFVAPQVAGATTLSFRVSVSDGTLTSVSDGVAITVTTPNDPPLCHLAHAWPPILWPPIHQMVPIKIWGVADPDNDRVVIKVFSVTQDEPVKGITYGDTSPDAVILSKGVLVRAERSDKGNGRVYQISFVADDGHGGSCKGAVRVKVPRGWTHPIDDGQIYDSTKP